jgi:hypothetical protein
LKYLALNPSGIFHTYGDKLSFYGGETKESERTLPHLQANGLNLDAVVEHLLEQIGE